MARKSKAQLYAEKRGHYAKQNFYAASLDDGAYQHQPQSPQAQQPSFTPGGAQVTCSKCNTRQPGGKFCAECGNALAQAKKFCTGCGQETAPAAKFCANCGTSTAAG